MVRFLKYAVLIAVVGCAITGVTFTRHLWLPLLKPGESVSSDAKADTSAQFALPNEQVNLSPQAQKNLKLTSKPLLPLTYWRTIAIETGA